MKITSRGPFTVMVASSLWAVDALIRTPLTKAIPSASIVLYEHVIGLLVFSPLFIRSLPILRTVSGKTWVHVLTLSLVSSVGGTVLFTQALAVSFATGDFITPLLLQKLQPLLVIMLAVLLLKEKLQKEFLLWAPVALVGSYLISFGLTVPKLQFAGKEMVVVLSLGAAACWGSGTILSKLLLRRYSARDATFFAFYSSGSSGTFGCIGVTTILSSHHTYSRPYYTFCNNLAFYRRCSTSFILCRPCQDQSTCGYCCRAYVSVNKRPDRRDKA